MRALRLIAAAAVAFLVAATGVFVYAPAPSAGAEDSAAVATNTKDGSSVFKIVFHVRRTMDGDVDNDNAAVAYSNCADCQTVAVSIQVVLAMGEVDSVTTDNVAIAINQNCSSCETMAAAFQYVFGNGAPVRFTADGQRRLALLRQRVARLRASGKDMTLEQIEAELASITSELEDILATELEPSGSAAATDESTTTTADPSSSSSTSTSTTATTQDDGDESSGSSTTSTTDGTAASTTTTP